MQRKTNTNAGSNYLTEAEEKKLLATIKGRKGKKAERDIMLIKLCRATGLRRGEALDLNVGDVLNTSKLIVDERIARKGGIGQVYMPRELQELITAFIRKKRKWGEDVSGDAPLFVSKKGGRLSPRAFNDLMATWCTAAGIEHYTPHALRHTKAQRIMAGLQDMPREQRDKKLLFVKSQLRHQSIESSAIYAGATKEEMIEVGNI